MKPSSPDSTTKGFDMFLRILIGAGTGAALGFGWYKLVGCPTGACPLTRHPVITILYGSFVGVLVATSFH